MNQIVGSWHVEVAAIPWLLIERYADDAVVHCATHCRAGEVLAARSREELGGSSWV